MLESAPVWVGFAGLSILSNKPVVPCIIVGTDRLYRPKNWLPFRRVPIWMGFGEPIKPRNDLPREQAQAILVEEVKRSLLALRDELVRHYGLDPSDLPQTPQRRKRENFIPGNRKRRSAG
jgi:1-acyl-sn-glycerol-3-phosphate acyltransferase